ncbi:hypothetical protein ASPZODRAFT_87270 [Penicilliopsis zonata CBS 506.65]|uniref:Urease accessory protein UreD n=1 Tax=Penicilliopsis zonata CBS 506.65 TaxID=1073090 RepID=A0A1L9SVM3_9EURO|nr:hypothetical protein ASPZODRAFT_87270 [Penicilliopsis zonata CBS 506.65]OJJ51194.1 hypothetical protein ASPZODRAFT_87270 [Penicilliopsis zonata CBS 506.65]
MPVLSPFQSSIAKPGQGKVVLTLLPPGIPTLKTLTYKYPLKLLTRTSGFVPESSASKNAARPVHLYLLSYGGGLLPGDQIEVSVTLEPCTRLVVTTPQGSTKIFKTEVEEVGTTRLAGGEEETRLQKMSRQVVDVRIDRGAALCYLPDPSVPFRDSRYEQVQRFTVVDGTVRDDAQRSSLCVLDWVTQGRTSRGENWDFHSWRGKNEVWSENDKKKKLLLRDSVILDQESQDPAAGYTLIRERTRPHGVVGTLILYGPLFESLASFFMDTFASLPRIGGRNWSTAPSTAADASHNNADGNVTWTAARVRAGFVLVKFGARDFETARSWLGGLLRREGSIAREFGEEALLFCS